jgi:hypothetical protein
MAPGTTAVLNSNASGSSSVILLVPQHIQTFKFELGVAGQPAALSLLRDYSAPVDVEGDAYDDSSSVRFLAMYDRNPFARWGQACRGTVATLASRAQRSLHT